MIDLLTEKATENAKNHTSTTLTVGELRAMVGLKPLVRKERKCLKCDEKFKHRIFRLCANCKNIAEGHYDCTDYTG